MLKPTVRPVEGRLARVLASHFDPDLGTPYWLERERELGLDVRRDVRSTEDLALLGALERRALLERPLEDFVPRRLWRERASLVLSETGGTTGRPVRSIYTPSEFEAAFGTPFVAASRPRGFPTGGRWLFVGPGGPHVIGRAAGLLARLHGALEPFSVDLDPRWARAQAPGSLGARLYLDHVVGQALDILAREPVDVLFTTPPLALELAGAMAPAARQAIRGIHLGGMALASEVHAAIRAAFERAVVLPAYGNSMFGIVPEVAEPVPDADGTIHADYFPLPGRLLLSVAGEAGRPVAFGESGRVVLGRLDESFLVAGHVERDVAVRIAAPPAVVERGFAAEGIRDPRPAAAEDLARGVY